MTVKASGRSALIVAAGLFVCFAGPSQAATGADGATAAVKPETAGAPVALAKYAKHHRKHASHRIAKAASKPSDDQKADADADHSSPIPSSVANANARLTSPDTPTSNAARAMTARANDIVQAAPGAAGDAQPAAETQVVAPDQLNEVDRALHETPPPATLAMASAEAPAAPTPAAAAAYNPPSTWDQTSLIGKIFIGFGALLTMASAARMFMA